MKIVLGWASNDMVVLSIVLGWTSNDMVVRSVVLGWASNDKVVRSVVLGLASNDKVVRSVVLGWASNDKVVRSIHSLSCAHRTVFKEDSELKKLFRPQDLIPYTACVIQPLMACSTVCHMYRHSGLVLRQIYISQL